MRPQGFAVIFEAKSRYQTRSGFIGKGGILLISHVFGMQGASITIVFHGSFKGMTENEGPIWTRIALQKNTPSLTFWYTDVLRMS
jgi:hypothetical protein